MLMEDITLRFEVISQQLEKSKRTCTNFFWTTTMGFPCAHKLKQLLDSNTPLARRCSSALVGCERPIQLPSSDQNSISQILSRMEARLRDFLPHQCVLLLQNWTKFSRLTLCEIPKVVHTRGRPAGTSESTISTF